MRKKTLSTKMILSAALLLTLGAGEAMAQKRAFPSRMYIVHSMSAHHS